MSVYQHWLLLVIGCLILNVDDLINTKSFRSSQTNSMNQISFVAKLGKPVTNWRLNLKYYIAPPKWSIYQRYTKRLLSDLASASFMPNHSHLFQDRTLEAILPWHFRKYQYKLPLKLTAQSDRQDFLASFESSFEY